MFCIRLHATGKLKICKFEFMKPSTSKPYKLIRDKRNKPKYVQLDLKKIPHTLEELEDMFDAIVAESRKDEPSIPWDKVKADLKKAGKL